MTVGWNHIMISPFLLLPHKIMSRRFSHFFVGTSLTLVPSGRHVVAGFTDGTLRLFDLTGRFSSGTESTATVSQYHDKSVCESHDDALSYDDEDDDDDDVGFDESTMSAVLTAPTGTTATTTTTSEDNSAVPHPRKRRNVEVASNQHQRFGAVACQIHARGVHTSLLMHVDVSQDGMFAFGGVLRGSMELVAVRLSDLETYHQRHEHNNADRTSSNSSSNTSTLSNNPAATPNLLDLITVYRHSDAKLRGFGACTRIRHHPGPNPKYLLFSGKAIKNIHIWSFEPHTNEQATWQCLYDTQTNGNTISHLHFRYDPHGLLLQGVSKSNGQKLRVWDLSFEQHLGDPQHPCYNKKTTPTMTTRPKRPPFCDVTNTEAALGVCGGFCLCGGAEFYNHLSIVSLNVDNLKSPFNHTELALPEPGSSNNNNNSTVCRPPRRQQRGDLKSVVNVIGMANDASHILLELSDRSVVHYRQGDTATAAAGHQQLETLSSSTFSSLAEGVERKTCLARVGSQGAVVAVVATYNPLWGRGSMTLHPIEYSIMDKDPAVIKEGFWGFLPIAPSTTSRTKSPAWADRQAIAACCIADGSASKVSIAASPLDTASTIMDDSDSHADDSRFVQTHFVDTPMAKPCRTTDRQDSVQQKAKQLEVAVGGAHVSPESSADPTIKVPCQVMRKRGDLMKYFGKRLQMASKTGERNEAKYDQRNDGYSFAGKPSPAVPRKIPMQSLEESMQSATTDDGKQREHDREGNNHVAKPSPAIPRKIPRPAKNESFKSCTSESILDGKDVKVLQEDDYRTSEALLALSLMIPKPSWEPEPSVLVRKHDDATEAKIGQDKRGPTQDAPLLPPMEATSKSSLSPSIFNDEMTQKEKHNMGDMSVLPSSSRPIDTPLNLLVSNSDLDDERQDKNVREGNKLTDKPSPAVPRKLPRASLVAPSTLASTADDGRKATQDQEGKPRTRYASPVVPRKTPKPLIKATGRPMASIDHSKTKSSKRTLKTAQEKVECIGHGKQHNDECGRLLFVVVILNFSQQRYNDRFCC